jgi:hypothetical protein
MQARFMKKAALAAAVAVGMASWAHASLVVDLVATNGTAGDVTVAANGASAQVKQVGDVVNFNIVATVTGTQTVNTAQGLQTIVGAVLSNLTAGGSAIGDMGSGGATSIVPNSTFNTITTQKGALQDVNSQPGLDAGGAPSDTTNGDFVIFSSGPTAATAASAPSGTASQNGSATTFILGTGSWTVTSISGTGATTLNWEYRTPSFANRAAAWQEDGQTVNDKNGVYTAGPGIAVNVAAPEPGTLALLGLGGMGLLLRRRRA